MIFKKYFAALISVAIVLMTALLAIPTGEINGAAIVQLTSVGVAAIVTYFVPLVNSTWAGALKTGAAVIAAIISIVAPIVQTHGAVTSTEIALMVLAALNALAVEIGVNVRLDTSDLLVIQDPTPVAVARTNAVDIVSENPAPWMPTTQTPEYVAPEPAPVDASVNLANQQDHTTSINTANLAE